ncbi:MAG: acyltransferase 3 [Chloroflexi bacterium]|nr:acyltransferase 3 [Chloroflexota bacterium]
MTSVAGVLGQATRPGWPRLRRADRVVTDPAPGTSIPAAAADASVRAEVFRPDVEGLRGVAILLVLLFHAELVPLAGGFIGVDVFFVISGFLITGLLVRERERTGRISLTGFYARRVRRLMPAALVVIMVTLPAASAILAPLDSPGVALDGAAAAASLANIRFAVAQGDYFTTLTSPSPFLHFWSLSVEEQFYLAWPFLLLLGARGSRPRLGAALALAAVLAVSLAASVVATETAPSWAFSGPVPAVLGWVGLIGVLAAAILFDPSMAYPGIAALVPTLGAVALIASGGRRGSPAGLLAIGPLRFLGRISYSLYLWHWPILVLAAAAAGAPLEPAARLGLVAGSIALAAASWACVEEPLRRGSWSLVRRPAPTLVVAGAALAFVVAFAGGLSYRQAHDLDLVSVSSAVGQEPADEDIAGDIDWMADVPDASLTGDETIADGLPTDDDPVSGLGWSEDLPDDLVPAGDIAPAAASRSPGETPIPSAKPTSRPSPTPRVSFVLPRDVRPSLARARADVERLNRDGCLAYEAATVPRRCVYGDRRGSFTVALVGDSHASHLFPAINAISSRHGWRLETYVKVSCPFIDMRVRNLALKREYRECPPWRNAVIARLAADPPDLIVVSNSRWTFPVRTEDRTVARQAAALARMLTRLPGTVVVVADIPAADRDIPGCLSSHVRDIRPCAVPRSTAFSGAMVARERAAAREAGARLVDLTRAVCPSDPCPAVVRGMIVLRDNHHLTATFARSLAPALDRALARILRSTSAPGTPSASPAAPPAPIPTPAPTSMSTPVSSPAMVRAPAAISTPTPR